MRTKFKKFGGDKIDDIILYLKDCLEKDPELTISVGCDSSQKRTSTMYGLTIMLYNGDIRNGAHVVFYREHLTKIRDHNVRLQMEAQKAYDVAEFLHNELEPFYTRKDLNDISMKKYKFHELKCSGTYDHIDRFKEDGVIKNMVVTDGDKARPWKLVDIHLDYNHKDIGMSSRGMSKNKSHQSYKIYVPWLRGMDYRVWVKPNAHSASSASDLLVK